MILFFLLCECVYGQIDWRRSLFSRGVGKQTVIFLKYAMVFLKVPVVTKNAILTMEKTLDVVQTTVDRSIGQIAAIYWGVTLVLPASQMSIVMRYSSDHNRHTRRHGNRVQVQVKLQTNKIK